MANPLSLFGTRIINERFIPLINLSLAWNSFIINMISFFILSQFYLINLNKNQSGPGLLFESHAQTTSFTSPTVKGATRKELSHPSTLFWNRYPGILAQTNSLFFKWLLKWLWNPTRISSTENLQIPSQNSPSIAFDLLLHLIQLLKNLEFVSPSRIHFALTCWWIFCCICF